jgi:hypothetical protein
MTMEFLRREPWYAIQNPRVIKEEGKGLISILTHLWKII